MREKLTRSITATIAATVMALGVAATTGAADAATVARGGSPVASQKIHYFVYKDYSSYEYCESAGYKYEAEGKITHYWYCDWDSPYWALYVGY